jgi:hypothetical protein
LWCNMLNSWVGATEQIRFTIDGALVCNRPSSELEARHFSRLEESLRWT